MFYVICSMFCYSAVTAVHVLSVSVALSGLSLHTEELPNFSALQQHDSSKLSLCLDLSLYCKQRSTFPWPVAQEKHERMRFCGHSSGIFKLSGTVRTFFPCKFFLKLLLFWFCRAPVVVSPAVVAAAQDYDTCKLCLSDEPGLMSARLCYTQNSF